MRRDSSGLGREQTGLWRAQGVATIGPRGLPRSALHGAASDVSPGAGGSSAGQGREDHAQRQVHALSARPGEQAVPRGAAECAVGERLHLRFNLERIRLRCVRHRRVRATDRRLEGVGLGPHRLRARCP